MELQTLSSKKEISKYLAKYFGYMPTSAEIVFYEIKQFPRKQKDFTDLDALDVFKELQRQFPDEHHSRIPPKKRPYIKKTAHTRIEKPKVEVIITRQELQRENRVLAMQMEYTKMQLERVRLWHIEKRIQIPDEIKNLFKKYDIKYW